MPPPPAFSRIALAAALVEYDNDSDDPNVVKRSAQESAIFSHLRRSGPVPKPQSVLEYDDLPEPRRTRNYLRIALPNDADVGLTSPPPPHDPSTRRSGETRRSLDILREQGEQYFQQDENGDDNEEGSDAVSSIEDVDLASWGLDSLIPEKTKVSKDKARPRQRSGPARIRPASEHLDNLPNPHSPQEMESESRMLRRPPPGPRSHSLFGDAGMKKLFLDEHITGNADASTFPLSGRRHTIAMPDEFGEMTSALPVLPPPPRPRSAAGISVDPSTAPFPRSRPGSALERLEPEEENAFAVPLPPPDRLSRFDPKALQSRPLSGSSWISTEELRVARQRTQSNVSFGEMQDVEDDSAARDPSVITGLADAGNRHSQMPVAPSLAETRRFSRMELMRPKVLIMPGPLREVKTKPDPVDAELKRRGGFADSTGDRPLPVNFRASAAPGVLPGPRPLSMVGGAGGLGEMLLPNNPRMSLSTTQLMFRNNLPVGGQRDVSYLDIDNRLARATQEGEKIEVYEEDPNYIENEFLELHRPTGKLLGKSLMDTLEARKAEIRGKRRVFTGDDRPSMMERQAVPKSTLIDPDSLNMPQIAVVDGEGRPIKQDGGDGTTRRPTLKGRRVSNGPLLDFGGANGDSAGLSTAATRSAAKARGSVFGVDTLWEREVSKLEKLKQAEAEAEAEEEGRRDDEARKSRTKHKKGKDKRKSQFSPGRTADENQAPTTSTRENQAPTLPDISRVSTSGRPRPKPVRDDFSDDEMAEFGAAGNNATHERRRESTATLGVKGWFAGGSDDEDDASRRSPDSRALTPNPAVPPGVRGPISPRAAGAPRLAPVADGDEDEDEDEPLVNKMNQIRGSVFAPLAPPEDDSDEDAPLVNLKEKARSSAGVAHKTPPQDLSPKPSLSPANAQNNDADEDEDNVPLGLRASTLFPSNLNVPRHSPQEDRSGARAASDEDEDEKPLGLRYSVAPLSAEQQQQRYSTMLQQQQQQQMYMQHMARNSMASFPGMGAFAPMGMSSVAPFMAPQMTGGTLPMGMGMPLPMSMPMAVPTPLPPNPADTAKISRVDNWRKGVQSTVPESV